MDEAAKQESAPGITASEGDVGSAAPSGVGGWLLVLVIGLTVLGPLVSIGRMDQVEQDVLASYPVLASSDAWAIYLRLSWSIIYSACLLSLLVGLGLLVVRRRTMVRIAIAALWAIGPVPVLALYVAGMAVFGPRGKALLPATIVSLAQAVVVAAVWSFYLYRSRRVARTYRRVQP